MRSCSLGAWPLGLLSHFLILLLAATAVWGEEGPGPTVGGANGAVEALERQAAGPERGVLGLPPDWSKDGHHIDRLIVWIHLLMAALLAGWITYLIYALWRFRDRASAPSVLEPPRGHLALGMAFAVFAVEVALMIFVEIPLWSRRSAPPPVDALLVRVVGEQFAWNFHYPGEDGLFGETSTDRIDGFNPLGLDWDDPAAADDLITVNEMHVPLGVPVRVQLSSKDVIHGFYLPHFRVKQDVLPGQSVELTFRPDRAGRSEIGCAQLCGLGHYRMRGYLTVEDPESFATWYEEEMAYM